MDRGLALAGDAIMHLSSATRSDHAKRTSSDEVAFGRRPRASRSVDHAPSRCLTERCETCWLSAVSPLILGPTLDGAKSSDQKPPSVPSPGRDPRGLSWQLAETSLPVGGKRSYLWRAIY